MPGRDRHQLVEPRRRQQPQVHSARTPAGRHLGHLDTTPPGPGAEIVGSGGIHGHRQHTTARHERAKRSMGLCLYIIILCPGRCNVSGLPRTNQGHTHHARQPHIREKHTPTPGKAHAHPTAKHLPTPREKHPPTPRESPRKAAKQPHGARFVPKADFFTTL